MGISGLVVVLVFLFFILASFGEAAGADRPLVLKPVAKERILPERILGINAATAFYEDLTEDPRKIDPTRELTPALLRFPGGTIANYYNWRSGQLEIPVKENSSQYTRIMGRVAQYTRRLHPFLVLSRWAMSSGLPWSGTLMS